MRISERARAVLGAAASVIVVLVAAGVTACDAEDRCIRFSDCASGYTCADTHCVRADELASAPASAADVDADVDGSPVGVVAVDAASGTGRDASVTDGPLADASVDAPVDAPSVD